MVISFLDSTFTQICDPIDDFSSLSYTKTGCRWEEHGEFKLVMNPDYYATVSPAKYVAFDGLVFNVTNRKTKDEDADGQMSLSGYSLSVLFDRVVITDNVRVRGNLEVQARALVATYAMTGFQTISGLALGTLAGFTRGIDATAKRGTRLADFLFTELNKRGYSWRISYTGGSLVFDVLRGLDRTQTQDANTPALFSSEEENVENVEYEQSETEYYNVAIVCDEDETAPKTVIVDQSNGEEKRVLYVKGTVAGQADGDAKYVIAGLNESTGYAYLATSTNGTTFTSKTMGTIQLITRVVYRNGRYYAATSSGLAYSDDSATWTLGGWDPLSEIAVYDGLIFGTRDPSGHNYLYIGYDPSSAQLVLDDGTTPRTIPYLAGSRYMRFPAYQPGDNITLDYTESEDGITYTTKSFGFSPEILGDIRSFTSAGLVYVAVGAEYYSAPHGASKVLIVSTIDGGISWNKINPSASEGPIVSVAFGGGLFVAVSYFGEAFVSSNAIDWTSVLVSGLYGTVYENVNIIHDGFNFRIYAEAGSGLSLKHSVSSDAQTWTTTTLSVGSSYIESAVYGTSAETGNLYQDGVDALESSRVVELLDCDTLPDSTPAIGTDCNLGDIVDIAHPKRGIIVSKRLIDLQAVIEPKNHTVKPKFGTNYLSMKKFIKKEIKNRV
jgi:hypothetical protein